MAYAFRFAVTLILIELCAAVNVALNRPATQTQTLDFNGYLWVAGYAVDGCTPPFPNNDYENSQCCSCSIDGTENVWTVTLDRPYVLDRVTVQGRSDIDTQLAGFRLFVRQDLSPELQVYDSTGDPYNSGFFDIPITFSGPVVEVTIKRTGGPLTLCEVEAFEVEQTSSTVADTTVLETTTTIPDTSTSPITPSPLVSRFKPASQANTLNYIFDWSADKAVDGDYRSSNPNFDASCATTQQPTDNFWKVDLLQQYIVDKIEVYTRTDGQDQITGFQVYGQTDDGFPEFLLHINNDPLGIGVFVVNVVPPTTLKHVIIKRNDLLTLCEVDVFGIPFAQPTSTIESTTESTTESITTTASPSSTTVQQRTSVALNKPAQQLEDLFYIFWWYASYAVDGCYERNDPNNVQCCSTSMGDLNNFWRVDLQMSVLIDLVVIYGRADQDDQLPGFELYIQAFDGAFEELIYDSTGVPYDDGIYTIAINPPRMAKHIIIKRDGIISLCEVDVFEAQALDPVTTTTTMAASTSTEATTTTTPIITSAASALASSTTIPSTAAITSVEQTSSTEATTTTLASTSTTVVFPSSPLVSRFKPASQANTLNYIFDWSADKAVDGDYRSSNPNFDASCATTQQATDNFWKVDLLQQYVVDKIEVYTRTDGQDQITGFQVYGQTDDGFPEFLLHINNDPLGIGVFVVNVVPPTTLKHVIIKRNDILTLCEVDVFGTLPPIATTTPAATTTTVETSTTSILQTTSAAQLDNVALNKPASQTDTLDFNGYLWEAGLAVDGCKPPFPGDDYEGSQCCSGSFATGENTWTVNLLAEYVVSRIIVIGRSNQETQLKDFQVFIRQDALSPEMLVYDNFGIPYGNGVFDITVTSTMPVSEVIVKRSDVLLLCEVEVFGVPFMPTTSTVSSTQAPVTSTETSTIATTETTQRSTTVGTSGGGINVAAGQLATHRLSLNYNGFEWTADKAVDGCYDRATPDISRCCSCSQEVDLGDNFWRVDFDDTYPLMKIVIYGRGDFGTQLDDFMVYANVTTGTPIYDSLGIPYTDGLYEIVLEPEVRANSLIVKRPIGMQYLYITLCEVEAISACDDGFFGNQCDNLCGKCFDNEPCYKITGTCPNQCAAGYQGTQCLTQCNAGNYGINCLEVCGNCALGASCDIFTGFCPQGCASGWKGDLCKTPCDAGTFGENCISLCGNCVAPTTCNSVTGQCESGCAPGWQSSDPMCMTPCVDGTYGSGCFLTCGNCLMGAACNKETGQCPGQCQAGWQEPMCNQECFDGFHGVSCLETCGECLGGAACDKTTGNCPSGLCSPGYSGADCKQECPDGTYGFACAETCGNCFNGEVCSPVDGACENGCDAGFSGSICKTECIPGTYGSNCLQTCGNCEFGAACDTVTGACPGNCAAGWQGINCDQACAAGSYGSNCLQTCGNCEFGAACDTVTGACPGNCAAGWQGINCDQACAAGSFGSNCLQTCGNCEFGAACDTVTGACPGNCASGWQGIICDQACTAGSYGSNCLQTCGNCEFGAACDTVTGACPGNCAAGWQGINCDLACAAGSHGSNCLQTCGNCEFGAACDTVTGACPGNCAAGWQGINCEQACTAGSFGSNCLQTCGNCEFGAACDTVTGACPGKCAAGWQGVNCDQACTAGSYGSNCLQTCGNCEFGAACDTVTGACPGNCAAGWQGINCDQAVPSTSTVSTSTKGASTTPSTSLQTTSVTEPPSSTLSSSTVPPSTPTPSAPTTPEPETTHSPITSTEPSTVDTTTGSDVSTQPTTIQVSTARSTQGSTVGPTQGSTVGPTQVSTVDPTQGSTAGPTQGSTVGPTQTSTVGPTQGSTVGPTVGPTQGSTVGPTQGSTTQPTQGSTAGSTHGPTVGPTQGSTAGPTQGSTAGPTQVTTTIQDTTSRVTQRTTVRHTSTQGSTTGSTQRSTHGQSDSSTNRSPPVSTGSGTSPSAPTVSTTYYDPYAAASTHTVSIVLMLVSVVVMFMLRMNQL